MAKTKTLFFCQSCGNESPKWLGRCPGCGEWNTFVEELVPAKAGPGGVFAGLIGLSGLGGPGGGAPVALKEVEITGERRVGTGFGELDRVLGGGLVPGSLILLGGDPGIGKSTLWLQVANHTAGRGMKALYVSGEESTRQTRMRADRLGEIAGGLMVQAETDLAVVIKQAEAIRPDLLVVDSIQAVYRADLESAPGGVGQVRECAAALLKLAKTTGIAVVMLGHVNKAGDLAGPRVLEHVVDSVLYLEGERHQSYRILRGVKNRFGSTNEIGLFEMTDSGLREVANPSQVLLSERPQGVSGSVVACSLEGTRPLLVEVQALMVASPYGTARRTVAGVDQNRVALILAVLEKRCGLNLSGHDAYVKVSGGIRIEEPAVDLGLAVALASSYREVPADPGTVVFGEVGLAGEVKACSRIDQRIREASRLGFTRCVVPAGGLPQEACGIEVVGVRSVAEAIEACLT